MTVEITKRRTSRVTQERKAQQLRPLRIELTNDDILADLQYPVPLRRRRRI